MSDKACANCRWWKPFDTGNGDPETGMCTSVIDNEYAQTDLRHEDSQQRPVLFITYAEFWCSDHQYEEGE